MSKGWNDLMLKKLKALMGKGLSTAEMGKKLGMSKNAVVGKLNRLGWNAKANEAETKNTKKSGKTTKVPAKTTKNTKVVSKKTTKVVAKPTKKAIVTKAKATSKTAVKKEKTPAKKPVVAKKTTATKKAVEKKSVKKPVVAKKEPKKAVKPVIKMPVIKTASKKTKKDLASHELYIEHAKKMAELKPNQCRWPIGDPDSNNFRFCGEPVFPGKPYCYEHCRQAYQFTPVKKK